MRAAAMTRDPAFPGSATHAGTTPSPVNSKAALELTRAEQRARQWQAR